MNDEIRVSVASYGDGRNLMMTFRDPVTGKKVARSTGTTDRREAERAAAVWQDELNSGRYQAPSRLTWAEFRRRYETEKLATLAPSTQVATTVSLDMLERTIAPGRLSRLTAAVMSRFQAKLREGGMRDTTLARHLRTVRAALSWGVSVGMLAKVPKVHMPKRVKGQTLMRGRPITAEEFERMLAVVPKVRPHDAPAWQRYLTGLWLSGLRLQESLALSWDQDAAFYADLSGRRPAFRIYGEAQKSGRDEILPMTPDLAQWLLHTPEAERVGPVFRLTARKTGRPIVYQEVGQMVSLIGKRAGVVVNKADGKFASAHDLRRAFGTRWAPRVKPATLQLLMRHADIGTTLKYYVAQDAADVADELWASYGATLTAGNTRGNSAPQKVAAGRG